jgi:UrcA family protein
MNQVHPTRRSVALLALVAGSVFAGAAMAATELKEVTIEGSRMTKEVTQGRVPGVNSSVQDVKLSMGVSYADLDLSLVKDGQELERRVEAAAKSICTELDKLLATPDTGCITDLTKQTHVKVDAAILAASQAHLAKSKADAAKAAKK